jgi:hypothetical protein
MSSETKTNPKFWSSPAAVAVNFAAAAGVGYILGGLTGSGVAAFAYALLLVTPAFLRMIARSGGAGFAIRAISLPFIALLAGFVTIAGFAVGLGTLALQRVVSLLPKRVRPATDQQAARDALPPAASQPMWRTAENLALLLANTIMLVVLGSIWFGIEVALYAALVATPIWLGVLIVVAVDASAPDEVANGTPELAEKSR